MEKAEKKTRTIKKKDKFIWFASSVVIAVIGIILHLSEVTTPSWFNILYAALILFTVIMAAQKTSVERFTYSGENRNKKLLIISTIIYYFFILVAVFYVFLSVWVSGILTL